MKKVILILALFGAVQVQAQNTDSLVIAELTPSCNNLDTLQTVIQWKMRQAEINKVKAKYPSHWLPAYYSAYAAIQMSYIDETQNLKDLYLDAADVDLATVTASCPLKDEVYILTAMVANARLAVDPMSRYKEYGKIFDDNLELARKVNENNPHIYLNKALSLYFTPKMFGGGSKNALPYFTKAEEKFKLLKEHSVGVPFWGEMTTAYFIGECKK